MTTLDNALMLAQQEILQPSHGLSEQAFAVHKPILDEGSPRIAYVDTELEQGAFFVYFPLMDEPYYFVVVIRETDAKLGVSTTYFEAAVLTSLVVKSETLLPDTITHQLGITSTKERAKGAPLRSGNQKALFTFWQFEPHHHILGDIEYKLNKLLLAIEPYAQNIAAFSKRADAGTHIYVGIVYKGYASQMWGWSLSATTIQQLATLNIAADLDLYASGPELLE